MSMHVVTPWTDLVLGEVSVEIFKWLVEQYGQEAIVAHALTFAVSGMLAYPMTEAFKAALGSLLPDSQKNKPLRVALLRLAPIVIGACVGVLLLPLPNGIAAGSLGGVFCIPLYHAITRRINHLAQTSGGTLKDPTQEP